MSIVVPVLSGMTPVLWKNGGIQRTMNVYQMYIEGTAVLHYDW